MTVITSNMLNFAFMEQSNHAELLINCYGSAADSQLNRHIETSESTQSQGLLIFHLHKYNFDVAVL